MEAFQLKNHGDSLFSLVAIHLIQTNMKSTIAPIVASILLAAATGTAFAADAAENWDNECASCHGADGKGQTKVGKKLKLKDYTDASVQAAMTDDEMTKAIHDGVIENGKEKMKPFKDTFSEAEIKALVEYIRKFKG